MASRGKLKKNGVPRKKPSKRKVKKGERIAQMVINKLPEVGIEEISEEEFKMPQNLTIRNSKGFGSTGRN